MGLNLCLSHMSQWISHIIVKLEYGKYYYLILPLQPLQHWYQLLILTATATSYHELWLMMVFKCLWFSL